MILRPDLYQAFIDAAHNRPYRPSLLAGLIMWESGFNPRAVGDCGYSVDDLLMIWEESGLEGAKETECSIGLGQVNVIHLAENLTVPDLLNPRINLEWAATYLEQHYLALGENERLAVAAYRGPKITYESQSWKWDEPRNSGIIALADRYDQEGIRPADTMPPPPPAPIENPTPQPVGTITVRVQIDGLDLKAIVEIPPQLQTLLAILKSLPTIGAS